MMPRADSAPGASPVENWSRDDSRVFAIGRRRLDPATGRIELHYALDGVALTERFQLPSPPVEPSCPAALDAALDLLHWTAGISYWKAGCPPTIEFEDRRPDAWQAAWLDRLCREGLAEFAWRNGLSCDNWAGFAAAAGERPAPAATCCRLARRSLVPMGGGKDSLVALERLRSRDEPLATVQVGSATLIREVAAAAGTPHRVVERRIDPRLAELNRRGAWNGHVPITAINAAVLIVLALVEGFDRIVFANERSADEATLVDPGGRAVNHQFSKSLAFETMLGEWVARCITPDLDVFSILRRDRELAVCREFAGLADRHAAFSSCNRNFHLDGSRTARWCGQCPKCLFVFLALAPFMTSARLERIFGDNLLERESLVAGFRELLALDGAKPFECVGEADEARAALAALGEDRHWRDSRVVQALLPLLADVDVPDLETLCLPGREHRIPDALLGDA